MLENTKKRSEKNEKPLPWSQAVSVNPKSYEDGIDADVPQARIFCGWNHELLSLTTNYGIKQRNCQLRFWKYCKHTPMFPDGIIALALSLWHYRFEVRFEDTRFKVL